MEAVTPIPKIRAGNEFTFIWSISRDGVAENFTDPTVTDLKLTVCVGGLCAERVEVPFTIVDTNKIRSSHLYERTGTYNLELTYKKAGVENEIDIEAFKIVARSAEASESSDFIVSSDMAIGFKGDKGDPGNYGVVEFVVNENMELEQHTLVGDPLDFSIVDGDLVLNEAGQTVNLGTVAIKDTYSYDEQRIGTWVNGKPIYRKVLLLPSTNGVEDITITHNLGIDEYIRMDIASNYINGDMPSATPLIPVNSCIYASQINSVSDMIELYDANIYPYFTYHLILEYTKLP